MFVVICSFTIRQGLYEVVTFYAHSIAGSYAIHIVTEIEYEYDLIDDC